MITRHKTVTVFNNFKCSFWPALSDTFFNTDLIATRFMLSIAELCWSIMLIWPGDSFDRPTYYIMSLTFEEEYWAALFLLSFILQNCVIIFKQYYTAFGRIFSVWNAMLWTFVSTSMLLSVYPPPAAIGGEIALTFAAIWICIRPSIIESMYHHADRK